MFVHISECVEIVYELPLVPNSTAVKHFYTDQEKCEVLTGYLSLGCQPRNDWVNTTLDKTFYKLLLKQEIVKTLSYFQIFFLNAFLDEAFIRNIIFILCINHIIIICINDNNAVITNNYGRFEDLILLFKIPIRT